MKISWLALCLVTAVSAGAQEGAEPAPTPIELDYQQGEISVGDDLARLHLPPDFRFLGPGDAQKVLVDLWGNPEGDLPLGMLVPADVDPDSPVGWAVIISFEEEGYVKDDDADKINYSDLLKEMKSDVTASNEERRKAGYETVDLVGWATPPHYDKVAKKLYWAKELRFGDAEENTLNYNIRMLGRRGVLVLNAVAAMGQLKDVEAATPAILTAVEFQPGHRYTDFVPSTDQVAAYGIGALIAGKVAAKAGFFKLLLGLLVAGKKFVGLIILAAAAGLKRLFGAKQNPK